jgi:hypothetical protein
MWVVMLVLAVIAIALSVSAFSGILTSRGTDVAGVLAIICLVAFRKPITAWAHSIGERHPFLAHWQGATERSFIFVGVGMVLILLVKALI